MYVIAWILGIGVGFAVVAGLLIAWYDRQETRAIRVYCTAHGCERVQVKVYPNHYGVTFYKAGRRFYGKCIPGKLGLEWLENDPKSLSAT